MAVSWVLGLLRGCLILVAGCLIVWLWFSCFSLLFCLMCLVACFVGVDFVFWLLGGCWWV